MESTAGAQQKNSTLAFGFNWKRALTLVFLCLVAFLLFTEARKIDWLAVGSSIQSLKTSSVIKALAATALSFAIYGCYDIISKAQIGHRATNLQSFFSAVVSYGFNLNFGALVGGIAFRYRLYSRFGISAGETTRIVGFSILSNWLGYALLLGLLLVFAPITPPTDWAHVVVYKDALGLVLIGAIACYIAACGFSKKRTFRILKKEFELPHPVIACIQVATSLSSWVTIGTVLYFLFEGTVPFWTLLLIHLASGLAAVIMQVPAGLGVTEAVYLAFLSSQLPTARVLASVFAFRAVYYLVPLALVAMAYFIFETLYRQRTTKV